MWVLNIIAFLIVTIYFSYKTKETMAEVFPVTACGLIFILYILAYFRCLSWIDGISIGVVVCSLAAFLKTEAAERKAWTDRIKKYLFHPTALMIICSVVMVSFLVQDRIALWWDDVNFWATDVKSIYYLNGFAGKYGNAAPEFGDYPPGVQLFKWWFLHFNPTEFKEGLMFAGYYTLNILLLAPLFSKMKKGTNKLWNVIQYVLGGICLFLLPSVVETFYLEGTCSDLPMGLAYGLFLWSVIDEKNHNIKFSYCRQILSLSLVMICKNTGFQWVLYGLIFWFVYHWFMYREERKSIFARFIGVSLMPVVVEGSWLLSCLLKRRVAKLTGAGIKMAVSGVVPDVDYRMELVKNFLKGFTVEPIHRQDTFGIDLSVMAFILLAVGAIYFFGRKQIISKKERNLLLVFFAVSGFVSYGITMIAHLTIFVTEMQYLEAVVMTASIERYGAPFTIGLLYILWGSWVTKEHAWKKYSYVIAMLGVCLCAQWPGTYHALGGYRSELETKQAERDAMVEEEALIFAEKTQDIWKEKGTRILYMRDGSKNHRVKDTYINYEVSPLGVVYGDITENLFQPEVCRQLIGQSHASYLYADSTQIESELLFTEMTEEFQYETLYQIEEQQGTVRLLPVE
mgnify:CR=1 FL=1